MKIVANPTVFGPKDVAQIAGLTAATQRDWRRSGYLPARETGWAKFNLEQLAAITLRKILATAGFGPSFADHILQSPLADRTVRNIAWWAVEAGPNAIALSGSVSERGREEFMAWQRDDHFGVVDAITGMKPTDRARLLQVTPATGEVELALDHTALDEEPAAAIMVTVHLDQMGGQIAEAAGRPLTTIVDVQGRRRR